MKKICSVACMVLVLALSVCTFGCNKVSQNYADKINDAAKNDKHYTYERVIKDLGDSVTADATASFGGSGRTGLVTAQKDGNVIMITFGNGKATSATFVEGNKE